LNRFPERSAAFAVALTLLLAVPAAGGAQGLFERLNLDKLKLTAMGGSYGAIQPSQMEATQAYSLHADYGEIANRWRVVFTVTYWGSRYREDVVRGFADSLGRSIEDPEENAELIASGVAVSDIAVGGDVRWMSPMRFVRFKPYLGGNLSVHVLNAEGKLIGGTFMEQALDNIATGIAGVAGMDIVVFSHLSVGAQARYDLLSGIRYSSLRIGGTYLFDRAPLNTPSR
jgi:hypothetical protein